MQDEHTTYKQLSKVAQQIRAAKALPPELNNASSLLVFLWALATIDWKMTVGLFEELLAQETDLPPIWGGLLAHLMQLGPAEEAQIVVQRNLPQLLQLHLQLSEKMDSEQEGLLRRQEGVKGDLLISPIVQTFWIWSNQALIELGAAAGEDVLPLILLNEVSVFEINDRLWMPETATFGQISVASGKLSAAEHFEGFLPLFAAIPDQEIAEEMYTQLKAVGLLIDKEDQSDVLPDIPLATAFMLYVGLLEYEMNGAAKALKRRYAKIAQNNLQPLANRSVALLWEKY